MNFAQSFIDVESPESLKLSQVGIKRSRIRKVGLYLFLYDIRMGIYEFLGLAGR
jgi:hypothetical protein